ncbi:rCG54973, partial [Rattus norvegicus]
MPLSGLYFSLCDFSWIPVTAAFKVKSGMFQGVKQGMEHETEAEEETKFSVQGQRQVKEPWLQFTGPVISGPPVFIQTLRPGLEPQLGEHKIGFIKNPWQQMDAQEGDCLRSDGATRSWL